LQLEESKVKVAKYFTELPDKKLLEKKLREVINISKNKT
jgi:hypothetical protein